MTLWTPGSSVDGISQKRIWSGLRFPALGDIPNPGLKTVSPVSPALKADSLYTESSEIGFSNHYYFQPNLILFNGFLTHTKHTSFTGIKDLNVKTKMFLFLFPIEECILKLEKEILK